MGNHPKRLYEFGPFRLDLEEHLLLHEGQPVALPPKVFDTLVLLVENSGRIIGKEEMMNLLWPDRYVEEANLTQNIFMLRKAMGEGLKAHYIETIPKRGYRFVAPVREVEGEVDAPETEKSAAAHEIGAEDEVEARREGDGKSLAVMPMINESNDAEVEYLSDGITECIINSLTQLTQVRVIASSLVFRYKGQDIDALRVGRELGADTVLVSRLLVWGNVFVVRAELIEVRTGWQLWVKRYHIPLSDILEMQDEVSLSVADKLNVQLTEEKKQQLRKYFTEKPEAYQAYLKGRYYWNKRTVAGYEKAIEHFQEAIAIDPDYALAYSGLADSYVSYDFYGIIPPWETSPKAKAAAIKALSIDETLAEAHTSLACVKMMYEQDWSAAESEFQKAIDLDWRYAHAHTWYSHFLMAMGRVEDSLAESLLALKLDPLNDSVNQYLGWHYIHARQFDRAISQLEKTLTYNPNFFLARMTLGMAYTQIGEFSKAVTEFQAARQLDTSPVILGFLGHAHAMAGEREAARGVLAELEELSKRGYVPPYSVGLIYTALGETPRAFEWFEKASEVNDAWMKLIKVTPEVDTLRSDLRFADLLRRLNLIQAA
ncbi:MAG TPA: tetratricopeptide repeat protein [Pyrinomonadaceae bacterium]